MVICGAIQLIWGTLIISALLLKVTIISTYKFSLILTRSSYSIYSIPSVEKRVIATQSTNNVHILLFREFILIYHIHANITLSKSIRDQ